MAGHAAPVTGKAQMLFCSGFHVDLRLCDMQSLGNIAPHLRDIVLQLRLLRDHGHIHIPYPVASSVDLLHNAGQQNPRVRSLVGSTLESAPLYFGSVSGK